MRASLRTNLLAAIGAVAAMTAIASGISAYVYANTETRLLLVLREEMPAITLALKLAEASRRYSNGAVSLIAAQNQMQRQSLNIGLEQQADSIRNYLFYLRSTTVQLSRIDEIEHLVGSLTEGLAKENELSDILLELKDQDRVSRHWVAQRQADYIIIMGALLNTITANNPSPANYILSIRKEGARLLMALTQGDQIIDRDQIEVTRKNITLFVGNLSHLLDDAPQNRSEVASLHQWLNALIAGDHSIDKTLSIRMDLSSKYHELNKQAADNQLTASKLMLKIGALVDRIQSDVEATGRQSEHDILLSRALMIGIAVAAFFGPVIFVWLIVGRTIVRPLTTLAEATKRIAAGDLHAPIPEGSGEIAVMSDALRVFRDNTAILAERTAALTESDTKLRATLAAEKTAREQAEMIVVELIRTQEQLIHAEKLAALGGLVAGVAHEINTPLGVTVTASSIVAEKIGNLRDLASRGKIRRADFDNFIAEVNEASDLLASNLNRAARLIQAFKQIAVDQSHDERRIFNLRECLDDLITSLKPSWHRAGHSISFACPDNLELDTFPGALDQILTNLIMNSIIHGFVPEVPGHINILVKEYGQDRIEIVYSDDGAGIPGNLTNRVFEPFFTTKRGAGSTGLGLHIVFNLVTARLGGTIELRSGPSQGVMFGIVFPRVANRDEKNAVL